MNSTSRFARFRRPLIALAVVLTMALLCRLTTTFTLTPPISTGPDGGVARNDTIRIEGDFVLEADQNGDLVVLANAITLPAGRTIAGDTALVGSTVTLGGVINGDLTVIAETITVLAGTRIAGDAALMAERIIYDGVTAGDLMLTAASIDLLPAAAVAGEVMACGDTITDRADGLLLQPCDDRASFAPFEWLIGLRDGSTVVDAGTLIGESGGAVLAFINLLTAFSLTALAALIVTVFPSQAGRITSALRQHPLRHWGAGLAFVGVFIGGLIALIVTLALFPPLGFLLMPICSVGMIAGLVLGLAGGSSLAQVTGERLMRGTEQPALVTTAIGGLAITVGLTLLSFLPGIGGLIAGLAGLLLAALSIGAAVASGRQPG